MSTPEAQVQPPLSPVAAIVAAVRTLLAYVTIALYVLVFAPPGLLLVAVFKWKAVLYVLGQGGVRLAMLVSGITYRVDGRENVPPGRAVVFCANHESNLDPPALFVALHPRLHVLYKAELNKLPLLGRVMRAGEFVAVERQNREQSMASIARGAELLRAGNSFLIFPEGTRSRTHELLPFKKGGFIMAIQAQVAIVPVAVSGGRAAMRKGSWLVRPVTMSIRIGEPLDTAGMSLDDRDQAIAVVRERIERLRMAGPIRNDGA